MSLREFLGERRLLLFIAAVMLFFAAIGVLFRDPGMVFDSEDARPVTMRQLGLDDPGLEEREPPFALPGVLREWNNQRLIGH